MKKDITFTPIDADPRPAAFYGRRSLEQRGVSEEEKSVALQRKLADTCAATRGETIASEYTFADDGVSGREFDRRPDFVRLMEIATKGKRAPFKTLYIAAQDRLGREQWETLYTFKKLDQAGVTIVPYRTGTPLKFDTPAERFALQALQFAADQEAASARERSLEKMVAKARAGHVTGSKVYGYDNHRTFDAAGKRAHAEYRINDTEAAGVRMIFELAAAGAGFMRIARALDAAGVKPPRQSTRWAPNSVRTILTNPRYRGEAYYMKTSQSDAKWGGKKMSKRPRAEWIAVPVPAIVSPDLWQRAAGHRATKTAALAKAGARGGKLHDGESKYLLTNFARCSVCGGPMAIKSVPPASAGAPRLRAYQCLTYHRRGSSGCANATSVLVERAEAAVIEAITGALSPAFAGKVAAHLKRLVTDRSSQAAAVKVRKEIAKLDAAIENLSAAIETAGNVKALAAKLAARQAEADAKRAELAGLDAPLPIPAALLNHPTKLAAAIERELAALTEPMQAGRLPEVRALFRQWLDGPIYFTPVGEPGRRAKRHRNQFGPRKNTRRFAFEGRIRLVGAFSGLAGELPTIGVSRTEHGEGGFARFSGLAA